MSGTYIPYPVVPSGSGGGGGTGTVTQVNSGTGLTGGPITTTGTLSVASVSLVNQVVGNLPLSQTSGSLSLTAQVVGILPAANSSGLNLLSGSVSLTTQVSGSLPISQTSGSVSLVNQVVGNLPLSQTSGSISLTAQVSGILPLANGGSIATGSNTGDVSFGVIGNTANAQGASVAAGQIVTLQPASSSFPGIVSSADQSFSGVKTFTQGNIIAGTDGIYAIGSASNASGSRYNAIYIKNRIVGGIFPASVGSQFFLLSTNEGPNSNPYLYMYTGSGNGYALGNDGVSMYILNVGAGVQQFASGTNNFKFVDTSSGLPYITGSTTALRLNKIPLQLVGSTSFNAVSLRADDNTGSYNFTLPASAGSTGFVLSSQNGLGSTSWVAASGTTPLSVASKIANYTSLPTDGLILVSSTAFTVTLFNASGNTGVIQRIKKTDAVFANIVTVVGTASQTIDGYSSRTLNTLNEAYTLVSDGANFQILEHDIDESLQSYTPTINSLGVVTNVNFRYRRTGPELYVRGTWNNGTPASTLWSLSLPSGLTIDNTNIVNTAVGSSGALVGQMYGDGGASATYNVVTAVNSSATFVYNANNTSGTTQLHPQSANTGMVAGALASIYFTVPISGWCG